MVESNINQILRDISKEYRDILGANLVGIYVHGSIAFECFNWDVSDIDYIVVVNRPLSFDEKRKVMDRTVSINKYAPQKGIEMSVVLKGNCLNFTYPTPFELHFSNSQLEWYCRSPQDYCNKMCGEDVDLAAHFTVIRRKGIALCGEPIDAVFGPIDHSYYLDSIKSDLANAEKDVLADPVYIILNLCRTAAYGKEGLILSKLDGGKWALHNVPNEYCEVIKSAISSYEFASEQPIEQEAAINFCRYMIELSSI